MRGQHHPIPHLTEAQAREEICRVGQSLFDRGYVHATAGNISVRLEHGFLITHAESISIADFLTLGDSARPSYRPTVHYAYHPCDDAVLSLQKSVELPSDSAVLISSEGLLGGNFIELQPGGMPDVLAPGDEIEDTQGAVSLVSLLMKFVGSKPADSAATAP